VLLDFTFILVLDLLLVIATWCLTTIIWNNVVRDGLRVESYRAWAYLLMIIVIIANAVIIAYLLQR